MTCDIVTTSKRFTGNKAARKKPSAAAEARRRWFCKTLNVRLPADLPAPWEKRLTALTNADSASILDCCSVEQLRAAIVAMEQLETTLKQLRAARPERYE